MTSRATMPPCSTVDSGASESLHDEPSPQTCCHTGRPCPVWTGAGRDGLGWAGCWDAETERNAACVGRDLQYRRTTSVDEVSHGGVILYMAMSARSWEYITHKASLLLMAYHQPLGQWL